MRSPGAHAAVPSVQKMLLISSHSPVLPSMNDTSQTVSTFKTSTRFSAADDAISLVRGLPTTRFWEPVQHHCPRTRNGLVCTTEENAACADVYERSADAVFEYDARGAWEMRDAHIRGLVSLL